MIKMQREEKQREMQLEMLFESLGKISGSSKLKESIKLYVERVEPHGKAYKTIMEETLARDAIELLLIGVQEHYIIKYLREGNAENPFIWYGISNDERALDLLGAFNTFSDDYFQCKDIEYVSYSAVSGKLADLVKIGKFECGCNKKDTE